MKAWQQTSLDPDYAVADLLISGAPAGIRVHPESCGFLPDLHDEAGIHHDDIHTDHSDVKNYCGVDNDPDASGEILQHIAKGHILDAASPDVLRTALWGDEPILLKTGMLTKIQEGVTKHRFILDTRESGLTKSCRENQRSIHPRILDVILQALILMSVFNGVNFHDCLEMFTIC